MKFVEDKNAGYRMFIDEISVKFSQREEKIKELFDSGNVEGILQRADAVKAKLRGALIDPDMPRGIAEVRSMGTEEGSSYQVENVLLTSKLGSLIPVNVYKPTNASGKLPAIVMSTGHDRRGKFYDDTQDMSANLAMNGFVVAAYDPLCQGERRVWDEDVLAMYLGADMPHDLITVSMHTQPGNLAYMLEKNLAAVFVNDSMTVVDYLLTREDVDAERLGATGRSGGGTQTLYLGACDDRIKFVSPIQCISKMRLMCVSGIGDCEQSLMNISAEDGFDYPDQVWACFPKPLFMNSALFDAFPVEGAREAEAELRQLYSLAAKAEDYDAKYAPCAHDSCEESMQNMLDWFVSRVFGAKAKKYAPITAFTDEQLSCFKEGEERNKPWDIYRKQLLEVKKQRSEDMEDVRVAIAKLMEYGTEKCDILMEEAEAGAVCFSAGEGKFRSQCQLFAGDKALLTVVIAPENYDVSALKSKGSVLLVHPWAMEAAYEKRVAGYDTETKLFLAGIISGKNALAQRVRHISAAVAYAAEKDSYDRIEILGVGAGSIPALFAAALDNKIDKAYLAALLPSYEMLFGMKAYCMPETNMLPGLLKIADIPAILKLPKAVELIDWAEATPFDYEV